MIKITNLNKYYNKGKSNEIHVINSTSINLPDTGFVSILGNSGSGKTTLLNVIAGLDKATGEIDYGDFKINKYSMKNIDAYRSKNIGYIFQNYNLVLQKISIFYVYFQMKKNQYSYINIL
jgi:ABC-type lipoprotein export system ATPase subunit